MKSFSLQWSPVSGWPEADSASASPNAQLLLAFGPVEAPPASWFAEVKDRWPQAKLIYCTSGGQIHGAEVVNSAVVLTGMHFDTAQVSVVSRDGADAVPGETLGSDLGAELSAIPALRHVLVFVDGLHVNGAAFARGLTAALPHGVTVSGGLASDGTNFIATGVGVDGAPEPHRIAAIGLSGEALRVATGSAGGWIPFGPERTVSRANGTNVFELDNEPALSVYKRFLGDLAPELPGSALLFPIALASTAGGQIVVRTILGIDEAAGSLRFAGDVPHGSKVKLMRSTTDQLLDGAAQAAHDALAGMQDCAPSVMLCISCIGRRAVLKSRVEEELEEVTRQVNGAVVSGYYSNGEIAPPLNSTIALLHNQTMTITAIGEV